MAGSRLEKIGTIYTRTTGLIKSKAIEWENRPLWYDIYEAFPPLEEPSFDRPAPKIPLRKIFYEEDKIRAVFQKRNKNIGAINMFDSKNKTLTQRFIQNYKNLETQYAGNATEQQLYQEAIDMLKRERETRRESASAAPEDDNISLSAAFTEAQQTSEPNPVLNVKIGDIFQK